VEGIIQRIVGRGVHIVLPINGDPSDSMANVPVAKLACVRSSKVRIIKPPIPICCVVLLLI
jgi:hypothetical protein